MKCHYIVCKVVCFLEFNHMFNVVISEEPEKFALRMKKSAAESLGRKFEMHQWKGISVENYNELRPFNPTNESYLTMKREDYSEYIEEEDEEEV